MALAVVCVGLAIWNAVLFYVMLTGRHMNDFGRFYCAARAFLQGQDVYGPTPVLLHRYLLWVGRPTQSCRD